MADHFGPENDPFQLSFPNQLKSLAHDDTGLSCDVKLDQNLLIDSDQLSIGPMIGEGSYSIVFQGLYKSIPVAIKVIQSDKSSAVGPEGKEKFEREITLLSRVTHDNIVKFIGASMEPITMIVTELMEGGTLQKFLWNIRPHCPDLMLSLSFALGISRANGIFARKGHHSLRFKTHPGNGLMTSSSKIEPVSNIPCNLLLNKDKNKIKVADFGLAREETGGEMTTEAGTYRWMAPELLIIDPIQTGVKKHYDHKVDVYSFSMVIWELLTNITPFKGRNNMMVAYAAVKNQRPSIDDIPKDIVPLLESCWAEEPADRSEFMQITECLASFLRNMCTSQTTPPKVFEIEQLESDAAENSPGTDHLMTVKSDVNNKNRSFCSSLLSWFHRCL
ncbi:hypothetical protein RJ639_033881 [Escallonia herrerae]|uniref:Protein kinase domain-containing protein n=1 Tax=Escallonia herrerae TaxID=1293975 RepID=A0AA88WW21_9ASTE|nr:hypothetical protein RJ639_033881 [Escallonia herrerae]